MKSIVKIETVTMSELRISKKTRKKPELKKSSPIKNATCTVIVTVLLLTGFCWNVSYAGSASAAGNTATVLNIAAAGNTSAASSDAPTTGELLNFNTDGLEIAIELVKSKIEIPDEYSEFTSNIDNYSGKTICRLHWGTPSSNGYVSGGSIDISVDSSGNFQSYSSYKYTRSYDYQRRLPRITGNEAYEYAKRFICYLCPEMIGSISFEKGSKNMSIEFDGSYRFYFPRTANEIPYYDNWISILVNGMTGDVTYLDKNWQDELVFPAPGKVIGIKAAQTAFRKNIGLKLKYFKDYTAEDTRIFPAYSTPLSDSDVAIDAAKGARQNINKSYYPFITQPYIPDIYRDYTDQSSNIPLTESELEEVKNYQALITAAQAEKLARNLSQTGIDSTFKLNSYVFARNKQSSPAYTLKLDFIKSITKGSSSSEDSSDSKDSSNSKNSSDSNVSNQKSALKTSTVQSDLSQKEKSEIVKNPDELNIRAEFTFDAVTSELINLNIMDSSGGQPANTKYNRQDLFRIAEKFLKSCKADKFKQVDPSPSQFPLTQYSQKYGAENLQNTGVFTFYRKINGIVYEANYLYIDIDTITGRILNFSEKWDDLELKPVTGIISQDRAYNSLFGQNELELKYALIQDSSVKEADLKNGGQPGFRIAAVYALDLKKPACIEAQKGILVDQYTSEPYREVGASYKDISGHKAAKEITSLAEARILPSEDNFRPDDIILQKELLLIINNMRGGYNTLGYNSANPGQKVLDGIYRILISDGVIDEEEREPDIQLTREDTVKYILRALGYRSFAELEGIFDSGFDDKNSINPKLTGYVSIAKALKIIPSGRLFQPKMKITRAEAATMIYNYLKRQ